MIICARSLAKATFLVKRKQTCDHLAKASIETIKQQKGPHGGCVGPRISPCILSKKTGDSNITLLNDGLTINLPCDQARHGFLSRPNLCLGGIGGTRHGTGTL